MANLSIVSPPPLEHRIWNNHVQITQLREGQRRENAAAERRLQEEMKLRNAYKVAGSIVQSGDLTAEAAADPYVQSALKDILGNQLAVQQGMMKRDLLGAQTRYYDARTANPPGSSGRTPRVLTPEEITRQRALGYKHLTEAKLLPYRQQLQVWTRQHDTWQRTRAAGEKRLAEIENELSGLAALPDDPSYQQKVIQRDALKQELSALTPPPPPVMPELGDFEDLPALGPDAAAPAAAEPGIMDRVVSGMKSLLGKGQPAGEDIIAGAPKAKPVSRGGSASDAAAEKWARENPDDPRAAQILRLLGK